MALASSVQRSRLSGVKFVVWSAMALRTALWWLCQNRTRTALDGLGTAFRAKMGLNQIRTKKPPERLCGLSGGDICNQADFWTPVVSFASAAWSALCSAGVNASRYHA